MSEDAALRASCTVDDDLADWDLPNRTAIPFEREFTNWGKPRRDDADLSALLYICWDAENLYFAAVVRDDSSVVRANDIEIWQDDNIIRRSPTDGLPVARRDV
jgi:hypothetical protein